jgi:cyanate permease
VSFARLAFAVFKGFVIIGVVGLCLLYVRAKYVDEERLMPWSLFAILMGGAISGAFGLAMKICMAEIRKTRTVPPEAKT